MRKILKDFPGETGIVVSVLLMLILSSLGLLVNIIYAAIVTYLFAKSLNNMSDDITTVLTWRDKFVTGLFIGIPLFLVISITFFLIIGLVLGLLIFLL